MENQSIPRRWALSFTVTIIYLMFLPEAVIRVAKKYYALYNELNLLASKFDYSLTLIILSILFTISLYVYLWNRKGIAFAANIAIMAVALIYWLVRLMNYINYMNDPW